jgi:glutamyl-tRNA synthetase
MFIYVLMTLLRNLAHFVITFSMTHEKTTPTVRFAPSPTGYIHIGNARTALLNWLFAKRDRGIFILRFDDTDLERSKPEYADAIARDLKWLGIDPDITVKQSERFSLYNAAADDLRERGLLYACYETPDELDRRRKRQLARGLPPVYDRAALQLTCEDKAKYEAEGRRPHWRFKLDAKTVVWHDLVRGECHVDCASLSDPVLVREDGSYLYTLPSVVDDIAMNVTHVIRGEDHVTNTAVQVQIFEALTANTIPHVPTFGHHNLLTTASGEGLSKRMGHLALMNLEKAGLEPMAVASLAVLVGTSQAVRPLATLKELAELVDMKGISRAPAKFDESELKHLNAKLLHEMTYEQVRPQLKALNIDAGETFWHVVRANLTHLDDAKTWHQSIFGPMTPVIEDQAFITRALELLPPEPWDGSTWGVWTNSLKEATGAKGKALFMPLRLALTGANHGPELAPLLPLIGVQEVKKRLKVGRP